MPTSSPTINKEVGVMPAAAAHYRFGQEVFSLMTGKVREAVASHKSSFELGLQGPDLLYYYKPLGKNKINSRGHELHDLSGSVFFSEAARVRPTGSLLAYVLGTCCHYALDRHCHPYIDEFGVDGRGHGILESDFDRYIMERDRVAVKRFALIPTRGIDYAGLSLVYPGVSAVELRSAAHSMRKFLYLLSKRSLVGVAETLIGRKGEYTALEADKRSDMPGTQRLYELYRESIDDAVVLCAHFCEAAETGQLDRDLFNLDFGGKVREV